jgi:membrane associated rhomboid family serine protease
VNGDFSKILVTPTFGPTEATLIQMGAARTDLVVSTGNSIQTFGFWRMFSALFMLDGFLTFAFTLMIEFSLMISLERKWGSLAMAVIWFCSCFGGMVASLIFIPTIKAGSTYGFSV